MTVSPALSSNIWKLYVDRFLMAFTILDPVLVYYYQYCGVDVSQTFVIQAVYSAAICLLEIPTGYISDTLGRKKILFVSCAIIPIGVLVYTTCRSFWGFVAAEIILAIGVSLRSGTDIALMYETLLALKREKELKRMEGTAFFLAKISTSIAYVTASALAKISVFLPFLAKILQAAALVPVIFMLKEPGRPGKQRQPLRKHLANVGNTVRFISQHREIRAVAIYSTVVAGTGLAGLWSFFILYNELKLDLVYGGSIAALAGLTGGIGGKLAHRIECRVGERRALMLPLLIGPFYIALSVIHTLYAIPFIFLITFLGGYFRPLMFDIVQRNTRSERRATTLSTISMGEHLAFVTLSLACSRITNFAGLRYAHLFLGITMLAAGTWAVIACNAAQKKAEETAS